MPSRQLYVINHDRKNEAYALIGPPGVDLDALFDECKWRNKSRKPSLARYVKFLTERGFHDYQEPWEAWNW